MIPFAVVFITFHDMGIEFIPSAQKHSPHIVNGRKPLAYLTFQNDKTIYQRERERQRYGIIESLSKVIMKTIHVS